MDPFLLRAQHRTFLLYILYSIYSATLPTKYSYNTYSESLSMAPSRSRSRRHNRSTDINIVNNAELRANAQSVLTMIRASRPKNTSLVYNPKQKEFKVEPLSLDRLHIYIRY
jgi:hypothetical protein